MTADAFPTTRPPKITDWHDAHRRRTWLVDTQCRRRNSSAAWMRSTDKCYLHREKPTWTSKRGERRRRIRMAFYSAVHCGKLLPCFHKPMNEARPMNGTTGREAVFVFSKAKGERKLKTFEDLFRSCLPHYYRCARHGRSWDVGLSTQKWGTGISIYTFFERGGRRTI